jgi:hypothetical protein
LAFAKKVAIGFIKVEMTLLKRITVLIDPFNPFIWWVEHKQQIPNF